MRRCGVGIGMIAAVRLEPAGVEIEEGDDQNGEEQAAVDAGPVQEISGGDEEDEIDRRGVGAMRRRVRRCRQRRRGGGLQEEEYRYPAPQTEHCD